MRFLVDVDEVLTEFVSRVIPIIQAICPGWALEQVPEDQWDIFSTLSFLQRDAIFAIMERPGFCYGFEPAEGAFAALQKLRGFGCEIFAVTAPNVIPNWCNERTLWLEKHMQIPRSHVAHTEAKYLLGGNFFLDDRPDNVAQWAAEHPQGVAMLWSTANNRRNRTGPGTQYRIEGWEAVIAKVLEVKEAA